MHRIAVASKVDDSRAKHFLLTLRERFPNIELTGVSTTQCYTIDAGINEYEVAQAAERLANLLTEVYSTGGILEPELFAYAVEIGFLPGVTDNVGKTARETIQDVLGRTLKNAEVVYSSRWIFLDGDLSPRDAEKIAGELHNPLIERVRITSAQEIRDGVSIIAPKVKLHGDPKAHAVNLSVSDEELEKIGKLGIPMRSIDTEEERPERQGPLALSLPAMKAIRDYFKKEGRNPTDVELEALAQTWSEHCKHTIFADPLDEVKEGIYKRYIKGATEKIRKAKGRKDFCVSVFNDNSGAIAFDKDYLITHKVETHNSPSALDPFGGAVTAIVGVNRDCLGFGLGAKPIANTYGFCVGDPKTEVDLFRDKELTQPLLSSRRILEGVVAGVNAGGNQSGIPTPLGFVAVDPSYRGKPLVYGGTVGLIPRKRGRRKLYEKKAKHGDYIVMIGGRVGLDGIHGATFSSESLSKGSPATSVQIGDPITQKKLSDALIREARDAGLYNSITDNGAGGLSGSVGEMAKESGGCFVGLDLVPVKYPGLAPWQIWISESQERMTLAVPKRNWLKLKKIFDRHDVEATRIGVFTKGGRCVVRFRKKKVVDVSMRFLHDGRPMEVQTSAPPFRAAKLSPAIPHEDLSRVLLAMLDRPNIGGISFISDQYDSEVQGNSVTKPLQGRGRVNADAVVLQPLPHSSKGIVLAHGFTSWYSSADTHKMAAAAIDTAIRNAICAGAKRDYLALLDNFCWSSSDTPERLYELKAAARACYEMATFYGTPFISGKDSMFNDFRGFNSGGEKVHIAALPSLLISAIGVIEDVAKSVTIDFKCEGDAIYLVGLTHSELGASEFDAMHEEEGGEEVLRPAGSNVPTVNMKNNALAYDAVAKATERNLVSSAIGVSRGGIGIALAKSAIAGGLGAQVNLQMVLGSAQGNDANILFSESQGRMLLSVRPDAEIEFKKIMRGALYMRLGEIRGKELTIKLPKQAIDLPMTELTAAYRSYFKDW